MYMYLYDKHTFQIVARDQLVGLSSLIIAVVRTRAAFGLSKTFFVRTIFLKKYKLIRKMT